MAKRTTVSVQLLPADELTPAHNNARKHSSEQVAQIRASIEEFGFTKPILVDGNEIVAGHGATLAVRDIYADGKTIRLPGGQALPVGTVPVISCTGWSNAQRRAYVIADNAIAENSEWDEVLRGVELNFLNEEGFDLSLTGLDAKAIEAALKGLVKPKNETVRGSVSSSTVNLTFAVVPTERDAIVEWLASEKKTRGLPTAAAALAALARENIVNG